MSAVFDALATPRRREILRLVWNAERSAGDIHRALGDVTFGAVSQHLAVLQSAGLVARRDQVRYRFYTARRKEMGPLGRWLESMWDEALVRLKTNAERGERSNARRLPTRRRANRPRRRRGTR